MDIPNLLLAVIWLLVAPCAAESGITPSTPEWAPGGPVVSGTPPDSSYGYMEPLRPRTALPHVSVETLRELAIDRVCALGLVALALMDCDETGVGGLDVLILLPASGAAPGTSASGTSDGGGPHVLDLRRRSIEQRMHSI
ncbi:MAG: hypothetical protein KY410_01425 [Proteobacteria bacterium]|nr:hypothetical protein [Pseudomonadota bacterium]